MLYKAKASEVIFDTFWLVNKDVWNILGVFLHILDEMQEVVMEERKMLLQARDNWVPRFCIIR